MLVEVTGLQPQGGVDSERAADAVQAVALLLAAGLVAAGVQVPIVLALNIADQPTPFVLTVGALTVGCLASSYIPGRWIQRRHSRLALIAASFTGCACLYLSVHALEPWPDLLSDEAVKAGDLRWMLELLKTPFVFVAAAAAAFGVLRYARHNRQRSGGAAQGRRGWSQ